MLGWISRSRAIAACVSSDLPACAKLAGPDSSGANLAGADLDQVDLSRAVLVGTKLERANCDWATKLPEGSELSCVGVTIARK